MVEHIYRPKQELPAKLKDCDSMMILVYRVTSNRIR